MQDPDAALVQRAGAGEAAACAQLVDRYLGKVLALCGRMLGNAADAEDAAQEVFLKVWQGAASWRPDARFSTWLYRVALNLCQRGSSPHGSAARAPGASGSGAAGSVLAAWASPLGCSAAGARGGSRWRSCARSWAPTSAT